MLLPRPKQQTHHPRIHWYLQCVHAFVPFGNQQNIGLPKVCMCVCVCANRGPPYKVTCVCNLSRAKSIGSAPTLWTCNLGILRFSSQQPPPPLSKGRSKSAESLRCLALEHKEQRAFQGIYIHLPFRVNWQNPSNFTNARRQFHGCPVCLWALQLVCSRQAHPISP